MGRKKTGLDEKLLSAADELFYAKGYTNTGISELVARAGTNKPGLYSYFQSKDEIARRYLSRRNQAMNDRIVAFGKESRSVVDFFRRWMADARDHARGAFGQYNGCAVANFALQTEIGQEEMQSFIRETGRRWQSQLVAYLRSEIRAGKFPAQPGAAVTARRMLLCNEGAILMWKITGNTQYFDEAVQMFEAALKSQ